MVESFVSGSLSHYALTHFVLHREHNGKDPYRQYDDFMKECYKKVLPHKTFARHEEYDDAYYAKLDSKGKQ